MFKLVVLLCFFLGFAFGEAPVTISAGGTTTTIASYSYTVAISKDKTFVCGGALISPKWVVTAVQCVPPSGTYTVRVASSSNTNGGGVHEVQNIIRHEGYKSDTNENDIALLQLADPVTNKNVIPIGLASEGVTPTDGSVATISGWGLSSEGGPPTTILQFVKVPVVSQSDCRAVHGSTSVTDGMFCVGEDGKGACAGDTGNPVVINRVLTGVVSWGDACVKPKDLTVLTSIPYFKSWIQSKTGI